MANLQKSEDLLIEEELEEGLRVNVRKFSLEMAMREPDNFPAECLEKATEKEQESIHRMRLNRHFYENEDGIPM